MAKLYVGTYSKYNSGSIAGAWLDLEDYSDVEEFLAAAAELHKDESDPELMFQDFEGFPKKFYAESHIDAALWDWLELDEDEREMCRVYWDNVDESADIDYIREAFRGKADNEADFASNYWEETGMLENVPDAVKYHIDYESVARDMGHDGFSFIRDGGELWVFFAH